MMSDTRIDIPSRALYMGYGWKGGSHDVDEKLTADTVWGLHLLSQSEGDIRLYINCLGGDQQHGYAIYDMIRNISNRVIGHVIGHCHSMAVWILLGCDWRVATENSQFMIHDGVGSKTDFDTAQDEYSRLLLLSRIRETNPDFPRKRLDKMLAKDTYLTALEARKLGIIDEILTSPKLRH